MYGGMDLDTREDVKAAFQAAPGVSPVRILLATDAAAEGLNLQNHCYRLIHYESPGTRIGSSNATAASIATGKKALSLPTGRSWFLFTTSSGRDTSNGKRMHSQDGRPTSRPIWSS